MNKCFTILSFLLTINFYAFSQKGAGAKIDSLKKIFPFLKDSGRVDCLIELSEAYLAFNTATAHSSIIDTGKINLQGRERL